MEDIIFARFYESGNHENAKKMSAYMKNKFPFIGINKPERQRLSKEFIRIKKQGKKIDWAFIDRCYKKKEREFHYLAIDYLLAMRKYLEKDDILKVGQLIVKNSWWDSTDALDNLVAELVSCFPELKSIILEWSDSDNIWLKRTAIDYQLKYKEKTDRDILSKVILDNCNTNEFFIDKAIGWSLREYSKTDKEWVREFITEHKLSKLSIREASKYL